MVTASAVIECYMAVSGHYGVSKWHNDYPLIDISLEISECSGEFVFDDNEIIIYLKQMSSKEELWRTMIHEYKHYLQNPSWFTRYYNMGYIYDNHPYELQALQEEEQWEQFTELNPYNL